MPSRLPALVMALLVAVSPAMAQGTASNTLTTSELKTDALAPPDTFVPSPAAPKSDRSVKSGPTILASALLGQTLYARDGARIGKISDVVLTHDLDSLLAVVGIGGFMGFGTRDVAIPKDSIAVSEDESGELKFTSLATMEQLELAPVFDRTAVMR